MLELLIVMLLLAGITAISAPRIASLRESSNMASARAQLTATLAAARQAAQQKGRTAMFIRNGNEIRAVVPAGAGIPELVVSPRLDMSAEYKVQVSKNAVALDTIRFNSRGMASPRMTGTGIYRLVGSARRDSVCVGVVGQIYPRGCAP